MAMTKIKLSCEARGILHDWRQREEQYSIYSTQSVGIYWQCDRCGEASDTATKPGS